MKRLLLALALLCLPSIAQAQVSQLCVRGAASNSCIPVSPSAPLPVQTTPSLPSVVTALAGNATGTTGAVVGTLTATATTTAYISGFSISAIGGTAAIGPITVAGLAGGSQVYQLLSSITGTTLVVNFAQAIPASAVNTNITVTTTADGTATAVTVNSWGFRL